MALGREFEVKDLIECMKNQYRISKGKTKDDGKITKDGELALSNAEFKGTCHKCGKTGHKKADCKEGEKETKFKGMCNHLTEKVIKKRTVLKRKRILASPQRTGSQK